ncbi:unnamed protein product [Aspergillus oryzae var. brunneus]|uniref:Unnamed protein product n=1 Tax=Aspergillus oryzae var. brunneus TaxID=332754 RepID=A0ABQ6KPD3_ASPOZ|nr:unnamed protein product [Aspergillus oryzae]GMG46538.1 unnamed protein product [Aspergillus oryzae var. brunneus]
MTEAILTDSAPSTGLQISKLQWKHQRTALEVMLSSLTPAECAQTMPYIAICCALLQSNTPMDPHAKCMLHKRYSEHSLPTLKS